MSTCSVLLSICPLVADPRESDPRRGALELHVKSGDSSPCPTVLSLLLEPSLSLVPFVSYRSCLHKDEFGAFSPLAPSLDYGFFPPK